MRIVVASWVIPRRCTIDYSLTISVGCVEYYFTFRRLLYYLLQLHPNNLRAFQYSYHLYWLRCYIIRTGTGGATSLHLPSPHVVLLHTTTSPVQPPCFTAPLPPPQFGVLLHTHAICKLRYYSCLPRRSRYYSYLTCRVAAPLQTYSLQAS